MSDHDYIVDMVEPLCIDSYCEFAIIEPGDVASAFFDTMLFTVYIYIKDREPIYVGYSSDLESRLRDHHQRFNSDYIALVGYDEEADARACEKELIKELNPGLNKIRYTGRNKKEIKGKRVQVKYKAFRLPLDFINELNIYSAKTGTSLEEIAYQALTEYLEKEAK